MKQILNKKILILLLVATLIIIVALSINNLISKANSNITKETGNIESISYNKETSVNIEKNNLISNYFPDDITEIRLINYLSDSSNPTTYTIKDIEKIKEFIKLFTNSTWTEYIAPNSENLKPIWKVIANGSTTTTFNMMRYSKRKYF